MTLSGGCGHQREPRKTGLLGIRLLSRRTGRASWQGGPACRKGRAWLTVPGSPSPRAPSLAVEGGLSLYCQRVHIAPDGTCPLSRGKWHVTIAQDLLRP